MLDKSEVVYFLAHLCSSPLFSLCLSLSLCLCVSVSLPLPGEVDEVIPCLNSRSIEIVLKLSVDYKLIMIRIRTDMPRNRNPNMYAICMYNMYARKSIL